MAPVNDVGQGNNGPMHTPTTATTPSTAGGHDADDLLDAVVAASRVLIAAAARSLALVAEDVTLAQYRVLTELAARGPRRLTDLADALEVNRSTITRMCDRLVRKGLVRRRRVRSDRRGVIVSLSALGDGLVCAVTRRRRADVADTIQRMPTAQRQAVLTSLRAFAQAGGEAPERAWPLGWGVDQ